MEVGYIGIVLSFLNSVICLDDNIYNYESSTVHKKSNVVKRPKEYTRWRVSPVTSLDFLVKVLDNDAFTPKYQNADLDSSESKEVKPSPVNYQPYETGPKGPEFLPNQYPSVKERLVIPVSFNKRYDEKADPDQYSYLGKSPSPQVSKRRTPLNDSRSRVNAGSSHRPPQPYINPTPLTVQENIVWKPVYLRNYFQRSCKSASSQKVNQLEYPTKTAYLTPSRTTLPEKLPNLIYDEDLSENKVSRKPTRTSSNVLLINNGRNTPSEGIDISEAEHAGTRPTLSKTSSRFEYYMGPTKHHVKSYPIQRRIEDTDAALEENKLRNETPLQMHTEERTNNDINNNIDDSSDNIVIDEDDVYRNISYPDENEDSNSKDEAMIAMKDLKELIPPEVSEKIKENAISALKNKDEVDFDDVLQPVKPNPTATEEKHTVYPTKSGNVPLKLADCTLFRIRTLNIEIIPTLDEIYTQLNTWADETHIAKILDITYGNLTIMDNPIYMMVVDDPSTGQLAADKNVVMLVAGIHGRDHHAVASAMFVLQQLIEKPNDNKPLLEKNRYWIIPVFNPDGYEYSVSFPNHRQWTKNLKQFWSDCKKSRPCSCQAKGIRCTLKPCYGVNLDRNFEYQWIPAEELEAEQPCGTLYAGERQLSEMESKALALFLQSQGSRLNTFITFKEGEVLGVMYPYSHTKNKRSFDQLYRDRSARSATAAYNVNGRPYVAGQTSEFLPLYAGGIEDWVDGHLGIENVYTVVMFRPTDSTNSKLTVDRIAKESLAAMSSLVLAKTDNPTSIVPVMLAHSDAAPREKPSIALQLILLYLIIYSSRQLIDLGY